MSNLQLENPNFLEKLAVIVSTGSWVAGYGFAIAAILKFKAHKDNPTGPSFLNDQDQQLLKQLWSSISDNQQNELAALGVDYDTLEISVEGLANLESGIMNTIIQSARKVGLE